MSKINLSLEAFEMDPNAVAESNKKIIALINEIDGYVEFMTQKITQVNDRFASKNYDRIVEALNNCKKKLEQAREEFNDLLYSCSQLAEKINIITH